MKWQYLTKPILYSVQTTNLNEVLRKLDEEGEKGWELAGIVPVRLTRTDFQAGEFVIRDFVAIFKRPKSSP